MIESNNSTSTAVHSNKCPVCGEPLYVCKSGTFKRCPACGYNETLSVGSPNTLLETLLDNEKFEEKPFNTGGMYGWICPKCGAVMSPFTSFCPNCTQRNWEITCTTTASADASVQPTLKSNFDVNNFIGGRKDKLGMSNGR